MYWSRSRKAPDGSWNCTAALRQAGLLDQRRRASRQGVGLVGRAAPQADAGDGGTQVR